MPKTATTSVTYLTSRDVFESDLDEIATLLVACNQDWDWLCFLPGQTFQVIRAYLAYNTPNQMLVGFAAITGDNQTYELSCLCVHPSQRHHGIGRNIIDRRVAKADERDLPALVTSLAIDNPLRSYYLKLGFHAVSGSSEDFIRIRPRVAAEP